MLEHLSITYKKNTGPAVLREPIIATVALRCAPRAIFLDLRSKALTKADLRDKYQLVVDNGLQPRIERKPNLWTGNGVW